MSLTAPAHRTTRLPRRPRRPRRLIVALVIVAAVSGALVYLSAAASDHPAAMQHTSESSAAEAAEAPQIGDAGLGAPGRDGAGDAADGTTDEADGVLPAGATVFDDRYPGIANIDPDLLGAVRAAADEAARHGIVFEVASGWRSPEYQSRLLREAIATYGPEEAGRWVATPETSAHVSGDAIDLGPSDALSWLSQHGAGYGLCQVYANEPWHYELRADAVGRGCPAAYGDPTQDPRMRR